MRIPAGVVVETLLALGSMCDRPWQEQLYHQQQARTAVHASDAHRDAKGIASKKAAGARAFSRGHGRG